MDATQMINDSILESDEEEQEEEEKRDALGKLCILKNQHIPESEYPLYMGENTLGRDPNTCSISLLAPSVSKQHATISLSVYRRKGGRDEVEALLWDMGSMNGTRKGHLKLTPNVRYALGEGDGLVLADIPCKYTKCTSGDTRAAVTPNLKTRDVLTENGGNLNISNAKGPAASTKIEALVGVEGTQGTPARTSGLSFEQTPTQPQSSLVPDSESESGEDEAGAGDGGRKAAVSDSDAHKSSPVCSTFMSPTNQVVPESEDESPITPSSSYRNRTRQVSFHTESDGDIHRQEQKKMAALDVVDDGEEETANANGSVQPKLSEADSSAVSEFKMDSDTDVEGEEEMLQVNNAPARATEQPEFHMDSDTDLEDDDQEVSLDNIFKNAQTSLVLQPKGMSISMDSDTDVEEEEEKPTAAAAPETSTGVQVSPDAGKFHMDSDTDVEDDAEAFELQPTNAETPKASANPDDLHLESDTDADEGEVEITPATLSGLDEKSTMSQSATFPRVQFGDSKTDDEGILDVPAASEPPEDLEVLSNSDTDVEEDSPDGKPTASAHVAAECEAESAATGVSCSAEDKTAAVDSDTDVEDNEAEIEETEDILQREITPGIQEVLFKNCSTPMQRQEGNMEEMETQAFLSPSISAYRCAVAPQRTGELSSSFSQEDEYVVAETQSFILNDRAQDPNISSGSPVTEKHASNSSGADFQLDLSESSVLQCQAQALAMESTQAFINLEETQPYAVITEENNTAVNIALQATQAYFDLKDVDEKGEHAEGVQVFVKEATPLEYLSAAPTQPMCIDEEWDGVESAAVFRHKKAKQIHEEDTQRFTNARVASTQPMEIQDGSETDENPAKTEDETQANSDIIQAQTVPMEMPQDRESDEDSAVFRKKKVTDGQENGTQQNSDFIVAQTVPMEIPDDAEESDDDAPVSRKRTAKQPLSREEERESMEAHQAEGTDEEDSGPMFRKRKVKCIATVEDTQPSLESEITLAPTQPIPAAEESATEDSIIPVGIKIRMTVQPKQTENSELAPTQPMLLSENEESDKEDVFPAPRKSKVRKLEDTQPLNSQVGAEDEKGGGECSNVGMRARPGEVRLAKEKQDEVEDFVVEPTKRQTKERGKIAQVSKGRRGRAKVEGESEDEEEEENKMPAKLLKEIEDNTGIQKEKDEEEILDCQKREKEQKERLEKEQKEREELERLDKLQKEKHEKERREKLEDERLENERIKQEKKELAAKLKKEKEEKKQKEKLEGMQRLEREKKEQEEKRRAEKERAEKARLDSAIKQEEALQREQEEKERLENDKPKEVNQAPRARRSGRRTIAVPYSSSAVAEEDDVPAKRTRSRSNSSNSVCSEMSVSSNVSQTSRGRGRGRGARKTEGEKTAPRGRRRTIAATEVSASSPPRTQSSSNLFINNLLNSEFSASSESSLVRGRGGRPRGRGRKTETETQSEKPMQRGRKSARFGPQDEEVKGDDTQSSLSTRGKRGAKDTSSKCAPEDEKGNASASTADSKGGRMKRVETKKESQRQVLEVEENDEDKDAGFSGKRKAAARKPPARKSTKVTEDDTKSDKPKGKGRASTVLAKNSGEQSNSGSSANNMEQDEPQTPRSSVSRKRSSVDSESDTLAKTPRSSTASPSAARSRTVSHVYKVLFTGVQDEAGKRVLTRLGGEMAQDVANMNCLVTDKVRRTVKFLCAVAKGIPIVTTQWLEKSGKAGTFLSSHAYLVKDREQENKFDFKLQESLRVASGQPLLQGYEIHVTKSVKPEPVHMKDIISCSGAVFLPKMPSTGKPNTVVVSCEEDWSLCAPALSRGLPVVSSEFLLTGILQQKVDLETHRLSGPVPAGGRGRGRKKT